MLGSESELDECADSLAADASERVSNESSMSGRPAVILASASSRPKLTASKSAIAMMLLIDVLLIAIETKCTNHTPSTTLLDAG